MNKIYDESFYNSAVKERYLKNQSQAARISYGRVLKRASSIEAKLGRDLYDFNLGEIKQVLLLLKSTKMTTITATGIIIQNYIRWAIEQDLRTDNINPLDAVSSDEFYRQFLDTSEPTLFSHDDIMDWVDECINHQDKLAILGISEGIYGRQYSELLTLKMDRVREVSSDTLSYEVELFNESSDGSKESRVIPISNKLYNIMRIANNEEVNFKNNGLEFEGMRNNKNYLTKTDYIVRGAADARTKVEGNVPAASALINRRIKKISELYQVPTLTPTNIRNSGMLYTAHELYKESGKLGKEEYYAICERYNVGRTRDGGYVYARLKKDFLNMENLELLYGLE
ncbi:hypothetical protein PTQ21_12165 [Paenibacillus marchantiae]|uniref:phage lytic cycle repressor MrpR family protein n=1 Tax=Paenibacillus marchantiae TaxID=3026433 RepID=UPI00237A6040|nr:hypothetical protein [Paenibacillus marchantiae]WDQ34945.1 hypothetical protein PTQ21_12165 [Paenibacillus marchantiae]